MKYLYALVALCMISMVTAVPLSVVETEYVTIDKDLLTSAWSVILRGDNSADYVSFVQAEDITGEKDGTEVQAQKGFQLSSQIVSESCNYAMTDNPRKTDIFNYQIVKEGSGIPFWKTEEVADICNAKGAVLIYYKGFALGLWPVGDVNCVYKSTVATAGDVAEGKMNFQAKFSLKIDDGAPMVQTISTLASSQSNIPPMVTFKDGSKNVAIIRWIGGATYGEFCPSQDEVYAVQHSSNTWYTGNNDRYTEYNIQYIATKGLIDQLFDKLFYGDSKLSDADENTLKTSINTLNQRAQIALSEEPITSGARVSGASAIVDLPRDHLIYAPDFNVLLSADSLKLVYLIGKPKITSSSFKDCKEGGNNEIQVTVQNIGAAQGKFLLGASCESGISLDTTQRSITLNPQESGTITLPFKLSLTENAKKTCKISIVDSLNQLNKDETTVSADCIATTFCTPEGILSCAGEVEYICQKGQLVTTGSDNCKSSQCDRDAKCETGESFELCGGKQSSANDCATCNLDGVCDATETIYSCEVDCGITPPKDYTVFYVLGGAALAAGLWIALKYTKKRKRR